MAPRALAAPAVSEAAPEAVAMQAPAQEARARAGWRGVGESVYVRYEVCRQWLQHGLF